MAEIPCGGPYKKTQLLLSICTGLLPVYLSSLCIHFFSVYIVQVHSISIVLSVNLALCLRVANLARGIVMGGDDGYKWFGVGFLQVMIGRWSMQLVWCMSTCACGCPKSYLGEKQRRLPSSRHDDLMILECITNHKEAACCLRTAFEIS